MLGPGYKDLDRLDYMWQGGGGQGGKVGSGAGPQSEQVSTYGASIQNLYPQRKKALPSVERCFIPDRNALHQVQSLKRL